MKFLRISDILVDRLAAVKGTVLVHLVPYNILHSLPLHLILVLYFLFYSLIIHGEEESSTKQHYDTLKIEDSALTFHIHVTGTDSNRLLTTFLMPFITWKPSQTLQYWHVFKIWCLWNQFRSVLLL